MHGDLRRLELPDLTPADTKALAYSVLTDAQKKRFEETLELDFSFGIRGIARFRCNMFNQKGAVGAVYRQIPEKIRTFEELGLPGGHRQARRAAARPGARHRPDRQRQVDDAGGDDRQDQHRAARATSSPSKIRSSTCTTHKNCLVNQREVHADTQSFTNALRAALREDPDIVLIGEMRDLETVEAALKIAETGHLTFGTLHTNSAAADDQPHHRRVPGAPAVADPHAALARARGHRLSGAAAEGQRPGPRASRSRSWCPTPGIRNLIREDKVHQIYSAMQTGQEKVGMQTMNQSLASLYFKQPISLETAMAASSHRDELQEMINRGVGVVPGAGTRAGPAPAAARPAMRSR